MSRQSTAHVMFAPSASPIRSFATSVCVVAALWVMLFELNGWLFNNFEVTRHINWIFLPAALRMLSVMLLDWPAVVGIFVGAMITNYPVIGVNMTHSLIASVLTAAGPLAATRLTVSGLKIPADFRGIGAKHLYIFAIMGSLCNVIPHSIFFLAEGLKTWASGSIPMFIGDMIGTAIVLYTVSFGLKLGPKLRS